MAAPGKAGAVPPFLDTNVLLYLLSTDAGKADRAEDLLARGAMVGVQVLNEFANVARRKLSMSWDEVTDVLGLIRQRCTVRPLTFAVHEQALQIAPRYDLSWYDALIVAAALDGGCARLYSEDMHDGLAIKSALTGSRVVVRNPFAAS
ncbi:MAG: PIN domain-containing protein [Betaproteobacteria bacterium]|nr:MAG: PIN domain-containing protein [Betaproteobacteria bacterium]TMH35808.1 MAG: PIN domain-containing protein [Betaproteobacteria bacterium]